MNKIRVGIIGCGRVSDQHLARLAEDPRVHLAILCDPHEPSAARQQARFAPSADVLTDPMEALDTARIDAAVIASPTTTHYRQVIAALERGIDVLVEKPLAASTEEAEGIVRCCQTTGRRLAVSYQRRSQPIYRTARREFRDAADRYGAVREIHLNVCERWSQTIEGTWRDDPAFSGGYFADAGSHQIDSIFFMTGLEPVSVTARSISCGRRVAIRTTVDAELTGGARLFAHFVGDAQHWREDIVIHAEKADLVLRNGQEIERWQENQMSRFIYFASGSSPDRDFVDFLTSPEGRESSGAILAGAEDGLRMARWTDAVLSSAQSGQRIPISAGNG